MLTIPIFVPFIVSLGLDPIWFGVVFCVNTQIGLITPPMGTDLFAVKTIFNIPTTDILRGVTPFLLFELAFLALIVIFPELSLWLPGLMIGKQYGSNFTKNREHSLVSIGIDGIPSYGASNNPDGTHSDTLSVLVVSVVITCRSRLLTLDITCPSIMMDIAVDYHDGGRNMDRRITIISGTITLEAELNDTRTADAIWDALPIESTVNTWGQEIFFSILLSLEPEKGQEVVNVGDIGYWPPGKAFCIFFGTTPVSRAGEIRAASAVNVFGRVIGDPEVLETIADGDKIVIERTDSI